MSNEVKYEEAFQHFTELMSQNENEYSDLKNMASANRSKLG